MITTFSKGVSSNYLVNVVAYYLDIDRNTKQHILECDDVNEKIEIVIEKMTYESKVKELEKEIEGDKNLKQVSDAIDFLESVKKGETDASIIENKKEEK